jgi:hypothetical protein
MHPTCQQTSARLAGQPCSAFRSPEYAPIACGVRALVKFPGGIETHRSVGGRRLRGVWRQRQAAQELPWGRL